MNGTIFSTLAVISTLVLTVYAPTSQAHRCGAGELLVKPNDTVEYVIAQCPSNPSEADFDILDSGAAAVATVALTSSDDNGGIFTVTGVAPGSTAFRIYYRSKLPPIKSGMCNVAVTVAD